MILQALQPVAVRDASQDDEIDISPPTPPAVQPSQPSADQRLCLHVDGLKVRQPSSDALDALFLDLPFRASQSGRRHPHLI